MLKRYISCGILVAFFVSSILGPDLAQAQALNLPKPGVMVEPSVSFIPVMVKGLKVNPENPLSFDFIVDAGKSGFKTDSAAFKSESEKLIKYFLTSLTIKEDDLWVNLSPYEHGRMITEDFGKTELGQEMLAQDYILKQLSASMIHPEKDLGKAFWARVYSKAKEQFGDTDIPVDTFNKVWIVADRAKVLERNNTAFVVDAHLKVMLDTDYVAMQHDAVGALHATPLQSTAPMDFAKQIIREVVLPEIEKEVNQGKNFASLRQIYYAMILSTWFQKALKDSFLNQIYSNKSKTDGVLSDDPAMKEKIYAQYLEAYKKGVFNLIKDDDFLSPTRGHSAPEGGSVSPGTVPSEVALDMKATQGADRMPYQGVPRKYFSGGIPDLRKDLAQGVLQISQDAKGANLTMDNAAVVTANLLKSDAGVRADAAQALVPVDLSLLKKLTEGDGTRFILSHGYSLEIGKFTGTIRSVDVNVYKDGKLVKQYTFEKGLPESLRKMALGSEEVWREIIYYVNGMVPVIDDPNSKKFWLELSSDVRMKIMDFMAGQMVSKFNIEWQMMARISTFNEYILSDGLKRLSQKTVFNMRIQGDAFLISPGYDSAQAPDLSGKFLRAEVPTKREGLRQLSYYFHDNYRLVVMYGDNGNKPYAGLFKGDQLIGSHVFSSGLPMGSSFIESDPDRYWSSILSRIEMFPAFFFSDNHTEFTWKGLSINVRHELMSFMGSHQLSSLYISSAVSAKQINTIVLMGRLKDLKNTRDLTIGYSDVTKRLHIVPGYDVDRAMDVPNVSVYNDGKAAVLGEQSPEGQLFRDGERLPGMAFIFGTGNNGMAADENGHIVTDDKAIMELGHNILRRADGSWVFVGKQARGSKAVKEKGESSFEDNFSGLNIARRFVRSVGAEAMIVSFVDELPQGINNVADLLAFVLKDIDVADKENKERQKAAVGVILKSITKAVSEELRNQRSEQGIISFVMDLGEDIGRALSALFYEYHGERWVENFILVSGVGEKFAKVDGFEGDGDLFVQAIKKGLVAGLKSRRKTDAELSDARINVIAEGVRRSTMAWEREAFSARLTKDELRGYGDAKVYSLGFSVGGTKIGLMLIDRHGMAVKKMEQEWAGQYLPNPESFINGMVDLGRSLTQQAGVSFNQVVKIGIAFAGPVNEEEGVVGDLFPPPGLPFLENVNLAEKVRILWEAKKTIFEQRRSGLLMHFTALPSKFGIGDLGPEAYKFVDYLVKTGQSVWQFLPIGPTNPGDNSPYNSPSAFAGNELLISPEMLRDSGWLTQADLERVPQFPDGRIQDDRLIREYKRRLMFVAYNNFKKDVNVQAEFEAFVARESVWLNDYALYRVIKSMFKGKPWYEWGPEFKFRDPIYLKAAATGDEINRVNFEQFVFDRQMKALKTYANARGVKMYGDMPIYVAKDSADVWANIKLFKYDDQLNQLGVAGVPPDYFSKTGQLWGNPLYNWDAHKAGDFQWWIARMKRSLEMFDYVRVDHFRGLVQFWEVPSGDKTAENGKWMDVPTKDFLAALKAAFPQYHGRLPVIAEDLGVITDDVTQIMKENALPGMTVLHFADFNDPAHPYLPANYVVNSVAYVGTHDNKTTLFWWQKDVSNDQQKAFVYRQGSDKLRLSLGLQANAMTMDSPAALSIARVQDVLNMDEEGMENIPGVAEGNWGFRLKPGQLEADVEAAQNLLKLTVATGRNLDAAQNMILSTKDNTEVGGIDLKSKNMNLDVAKDGKGVEMKFDPAMMEEFKQGNFTGLVPVIIKITPITSVLPMLGMNEFEDAHKLT